jgi:pimeloyl-ACP methyl ester carboxylesterase
LTTRFTSEDSTIESRIHRTDDGAEIAYRVRPGSSPWLLLHALGCDASMWDDVIAGLPEDCGLVVPEHRGHGDSTLGWRRPDVEVLARDVIEILAREKVTRPAVAGISMGGYVAMAVAALAPDLARAWAFVSTRARADDEEGRAGRAEGLETLRRRGWRSFAAGLMSVLLSEDNPAFPAHRERMMKMFARAGDAGLTWTYIALANRPDRRQVLAALRAPAAVVVGDVDLLTPPHFAREIAATVPDSTLVVLPGVAHMSTLEAPREVAAALAGLPPSDET